MEAGGNGGWRSSAAAYAAAAWAFVFAAMSFYWALGGRMGVGTQAVSIQEQVDDPEFVAVLWATGALKVLAGVIALAFVRPLGRTVPRRALLVPGWVAAGFFLLYGGFGWIQALLWETGVNDIPPSVGEKASRWKLIFWEPFWLLGGFLFLLAVWQFQRRRPASAADNDSAVASATEPAAPGPSRAVPAPHRPPRPPGSSSDAYPAGG